MNPPIFVAFGVPTDANKHRVAVELRTDLVTEGEPGERWLVTGLVLA